MRALGLYLFGVLKDVDWQQGAVKVSKRLLVTYLIGFIAFSGVGLGFLFNPFSTKEAEAAWFNDSWGYRHQVTFTHNAAISTERRVQFSLDTAELISAGLMQSDCDDTRFTDPSGNILKFDLTGTCNNAATTYEVIFPSIINGSNLFYVYYGNPSVINAEVDSTGYTNLDPSGGDPSLTNPTSSGNQEKSPSPLAYWKFDEAQGTTANDSSSNNYDGTVSGSTWRTEDLCISGNCLSFDGSNDVVDAGNISALGGINKMTISLWFKQNGLATNKGLIAKSDYQTQDSWALQTDNSNSDELNFFVFNHISTDGGDNAVQTTNANLVSGIWYHVTVVYDGTQSNADRVKYYINGNPTATNTIGTIPTSLTSASSTVKIGKFGGTLDRFFNGSIDEVKIYDQILTSAQIKANYNSRSNPEGLAVQFGNNMIQNPGALSNGLVGYWKMEETATPSIDSSGSGGSGTWNGNTAAVSGKFGNAGTFDGTGDYVNVTTAAATELTAAVTMSAWIKTSTTGGTIISKVWGQMPANFPGYSIGLGSGAHGSGNCSTGIAGIWIGGGSNTWVCGSTNLTDGAWHQVVGTYDGTTAKVYVDTVLEGSGARTNGININVDTTIGDAFTGAIDEARIYHRALNNLEVIKLYEWAPGPVGYWKMDEGAGTTGYDSSGNSNDLTLNTASWNNSGKYGKAWSGDNTDNVLSRADDDDFDFAAGDSFTICMWQKSDSGTGNNGILVDKASNSAGYGIYLEGGGNVSFGIDDDASWGPDDVATGTTDIHAGDNKWYYVCGVKTGSSKIEVYINGILEGSDTSISATGSLANTDDLTMGAENTGGGNPLDGDLDEIKIYRYARTQAQIISDMNGGHPAPGSPVGSAMYHFRFDEGYGTTVNSSGNTTKTGTMTNMASPGTSTSGWTNSGKFGKALNFDGSNDYVTVASSNLPTGDFTYTAWYNLGDSGQNRALFGSDNGAAGDNDEVLLTREGADNKFHVYIDNGTAVITSTNTAPTGAWTHVALTRTGSAVTLYVNGQVQGTGTSSATLSFGSCQFLIGMDNTGACATTASPFLGSMDEVKVFNSGFTAEQVKLDMNSGKSQVLGAAGNKSGEAAGAASQEYCVPGDSTSCAAPVGRWDFEENAKNASDPIYDTSGNDLSSYVDPSGNVTPTNGKVGWAYYLPGSGNHRLLVADNNAIDLNQNFTVEFWVKFANSSSINFITKRTGIYNGGDNTIYFSKTDATDWTSTGTLSSPTSWNHITLVSNASGARVYVNGIQTNQTSTTQSSWWTDASDLYIGDLSSSNSVTIDQLKIFNYDRTPAQVFWDYNQGKPIAHWRMDECQGTTIHDSSGNNLNGTLTIGAGGEDTVGNCATSSTAWGSGATGKSNYSLSFDATDDYISASAASLPTADFTYAFWIKPTIFNDAIFDSQNSSDVEQIYIDVASNKIDLAVGGSIILSSTNNSIANNTWSHVVITRSGNNFTIFVNGNQNNNTTNATAIGFDNCNFYLGGDSSSCSGAPSAQWYNGLLDDFRIYNYALTQTQVKTLFNEGAVRFGPTTGAP